MEINNKEQEGHGELYSQSNAISAWILPSMAMTTFLSLLSIVNGRNSPWIEIYTIRKLQTKQALSVHVADVYQTC